jgi:hypothetical protein
VWLAIQNSCFGVLKPTQTMSGAAELMHAITASSSSDESGDFG